MPSISQLLTSHRRLLVLDAASQQVQLGVLRDRSPSVWRVTEEEAGTGVFSCARDLLAEVGLPIEEIGAFLYCEGPGSMLGIRSVAIAIRTWQMLAPRPAYSYQSLAIAGKFEWLAAAPRGFTMIADARRDHWHVQTIVADGQTHPLQRVPASQVPAGELVTPEKFRAWAPPPRPPAVCRYDLARIFPAVADLELFTLSELPDAFQHEAPSYRKWSAQIHSVMTAEKK
jgi:tRNA threonylcarbamoyladenosine biosynthesis protein TsaB